MAQVSCDSSISTRQNFSLHSSSALPISFPLPLIRRSLMNLEGCRAQSSRGGSWSVGRCGTRGRIWELTALTLLKATKLCWARKEEQGGRKKNP